MSSVKPQTSGCMSVVNIVVLILTVALAKGFWIVPCVGLCTGWLPLLLKIPTKDVEVRNPAFARLSAGAIETETITATDTASWQYRIWLGCQIVFWIATIASGIYGVASIFKAV